jgi:hypothetical protein
MESNIQEIEAIYYRKISLFRQLIDCIALEKDNLINLDIKNLWSVMEEKQKILGSIEDARDQLKDIRGDNAPFHDIPIKDRQAIMELSQTLIDLKEEIKTRVTENVTFINETLDFFHELFSVFTKADMPEDSYGPLRNNRKGSSNLIYHNEV